MSTPTPPVAKRAPHHLETHGHVREDDYYWLRDDGRTDREVLGYLEAETAYTRAMTAHTETLQGALFDEIVGRIVKDDASVPYLLEGYWYYTRDEEGKEYPIHCRKKGSLEADEQIILDVNALAEGHDYYAAAGLAITPDGKTLAYCDDTVSRRVYTMHFKNLETGETSDVTIPDVSPSAAWAKDNQTVFYVRKEEGTLREYQLWRHRLGTPVSDDVMVYEETDAEFYLWLGKTKSRDYIVVGSHQTITREERLIDASDPHSDPVVVHPRERGHEYTCDHGGGRFFIKTNWQAKNFRLMSAELGETRDRDAWREEIAADDDVYLADFELFTDHLVVTERAGAMTRMRVIPWADRAAAYKIGFDEEVYVVGAGINVDVSSRTLRINYTSMTTPPSVIDYNLDTTERELKKEQPVLGGFDKANYVSRRIVATAADGTPIPVSLVHRRDLDRTKPQPLLEYGYGSYGLSTDPNFSSIRISLLDRGFIWAIAHVRGGQENGRPWYEAGKLLEKRNTFTDFIDVATHLVDEGWTSSDKLFAFGGSAGGLLMGAIANMRPELYRGIVASVPFVDVVTTMLDESIPLTTYEYDEWGNPNDKTFYDYMLSYSPYDNVTAQDYPEMMILTGLHDSQVQYWEPAKWVARLRATGTGDSRLLFHVNLEAGHGGASGRFRRHKETALWFAFLLELVGVSD